MRTEEDELNEKNLKNILLKNKTEFEFWTEDAITSFNTTDKKSNGKNVTHKI